MVGFCSYITTVFWDFTHRQKTCVAAHRNATLHFISLCYLLPFNSLNHSSL